MSHTVVRGKPNDSQLYLDRVLDAILAEQGIKPDPKQRENVTLSQIMYHCLKERPEKVFMTNGATDENITNGQLLKQAVLLARSLTAKGARGKYVMLMMRNHQNTVAIYFAVMFAGVIPFMMDPNSTVYELIHFLNLIEPSFIIHDQEFQEPLQEALRGVNGLKPSTLVIDKPGVLKQFVEGFSDDVHGFQVAPVSMDDPVMLLPTSGSTGVPKAAILTHRGLVAQLPSPWSYHTLFPTPTNKLMVLTTIQWGTFTMMVTSCTAYHIPLLMSSKKTTVEHVSFMLETYRPTWVFLAPAFATSLIVTIRPDQLKSVDTLMLLGAPPSPELIAAFKSKLPRKAHLCDGYGCTEAQGFIAVPDGEAPAKSNGWVFNLLHYKIMDDQGQELGPNQSGELYVKGVCMIKGYHKNKSSYDESFTPDGWLKTGDVFHVDQNERISFVIRKKFSFKYNGCQVAPEEVERVISSVPGVHESVVCATEGGPAAAVVLRPNVDVSREDIHKAVNSTLSDHKRLHGGIAFVTSLPYTHSGKLKRRDCSKLIEELIESRECY